MGRTEIKFCVLYAYGAAGAAGATATAATSTNHQQQTKVQNALAKHRDRPFLYHRKRLISETNRVSPSYIQCETKTNCGDEKRARMQRKG